MAGGDAVQQSAQVLISKTLRDGPFSWYASWLQACHLRSD
jgi:hypothetical protein